MNFIPKIEYIELGTGLPKTIIFDNPPEGDPLKESFKPNMKVTKSNNGTKQTQFNYLEQVYALAFLYQTEVLKEEVLDFYKNHGVRGGKFNYYIHEDEIDYETFELATRGFKLSRPIPNGSGDFEYDFKLKIERVISVI